MLPADGSSTVSAPRRGGQLLRIQHLQSLATFFCGGPEVSNVNVQVSGELGEYLNTVSY